MFTAWLQRAFRCPLVIQLTDDEKSLFRGLPQDEARRLARENAKDIVACGFDVSRTFIFSDFEYVGGPFYRHVVAIQRCGFAFAFWFGFCCCFCLLFACTIMRAHAFVCARQIH